MDKQPRTLKQITRIRLLHFVASLIVLIMAVSAALLYGNTRSEEARRSHQIFQQVQDVLDENQMSLEKEKETYAATSLANARTVAYILQYHPEARDDVQELEKICQNLEIDEIHIFNDKGVIIQGTQPQYYGYSFDSGEQMAFFKPLLKDKSLELVQDMMPNTAAGKQEQYSALWSEDGSFIVEVGMHPERVLEYLERNELPYVFHLVGAGGDSTLYSVDPDADRINASSNDEEIDVQLEDIGLSQDQVRNGSKGFFTRIDGILNFCVSEKMESGYFVRAVKANTMLANMLIVELILLIAVLGVFSLLTIVVMRLMDRNVIRPIQGINELLKAITKGEYDNRIEAQRSAEFSLLGTYVNEMTESIQTHVSAVQYQSSHDVLTNVWNRNAFQDKVKALYQTNLSAGIMYADLNGLKSLNDTYGHEVGDRAIIELADSLVRIFGKEVVYRVGGDEFVVVDDCSSEEDMREKELKLQEMWGSKEHAVSTGMVFCPDTVYIDEYIRQADEAMYMMKRAYYDTHQDKDPRKQAR